MALFSICTRLKTCNSIHLYGSYALPSQGSGRAILANVEQCPPGPLQEKKSQEFAELKQGDMSVAEYEVKLTELSLFFFATHCKP